MIAASSPSSPTHRNNISLEWFAAILRKLVLLSGAIAGVGLLTMMGVTCLDIVFRALGHPVPGAYDIVKMAAAVTIACALPYTSAIKGHVAVEFFYHRLGPRGRAVADTVIRLLMLALLILFAWYLVRYGATLRSRGEVSMTLQVPLFWVPYVMAFALSVNALVTLYHLLHPGKALLKP